MTKKRRKFASGLKVASMDNDDRYLAKFTIATLALTLALLWAIT